MYIKNVLFVGDLHGLTKWDKPVYSALRDFSHIVFLGDYVDSFFLQPYEIIENLKEIINLKVKYPEKINLLLGNHDYAYMFGFTSISGFKRNAFENYRKIFSDNWDLFDIAWGYKGERCTHGHTKPRYTLATHAGLTQHFWNNRIIPEIEKKGTVMNKLIGNNWKDLSIHKVLNYFKDQSTIMWEVGSMRGGYNSTGGVLWSDKHELFQDNYEGIDQIIGHTPSAYIEIKQKEKDTIYIIDCYRNESVFSLHLEL